MVILCYLLQKYNKNYSFSTVFDNVRIALTNDSISTGGFPWSKVGEVCTVSPVFIVKKACAAASTALLSVGGASVPIFSISTSLRALVILFHCEVVEATLLILFLLFATEMESCVTLTFRKKPLDAASYSTTGLFFPSFFVTVSVSWLQPLADISNRNIIDNVFI